MWGQQKRTRTVCSEQQQLGKKKTDEPLLSVFRPYCTLLPWPWNGWMHRRAQNSFFSGKNFYFHHRHSYLYLHMSLPLFLGLTYFYCCYSEPPLHTLESHLHSAPGNCVYFYLVHHHNVQWSATATGDWSRPSIYGASEENHCSEAYEWCFGVQIHSRMDTTSETKEHSSRVKVFCDYSAECTEKVQQRLYQKTAFCLLLNASAKDERTERSHFKHYSLSREHRSEAGLTVSIIAKSLSQNTIKHSLTEQLMV